jgi:hypothetical protein
MSLRTSSQEDWILRQLQALAAALGRLLGRRQAGEHAEALVEVDAARRALLGNVHDLVASVDSATAAHIVGDPRLLLGLARLANEEALVRRALGDAQRATSSIRRAMELAIESATRDPTLDAPRELARSLATELDPEQLAPQYRARLGSLLAP